MENTVKTRNKVGHPIFGTAKDINSNVLPTYEDVLRCYFLVQAELKGTTSKQPAEYEVMNILANKIERVWQHASLPIVGTKRIIAMLSEYHKKYRNLIKPLKSRNTASLQEKVKKFKLEAQALFDISACKCLSFDLCQCEKLKKVPKIEQAFLKDQRGPRKMQIGGVDKIITKNNQKRQERERQLTSKPGPSGCQNETSSDIFIPSNLLEDSSSSEECDDISQDENFKWSYSLEIELKSSALGKNKTQMRVSLPNIAKMADMTGASNRTVAKIATATLEDFGIVSLDNPVNVIDKNKIRREVQKKRKLTKPTISDNPKVIEGLYFDGRKDQTMVMTEGRRVIIQEEHIALIEEPESRYLDHLTIEGSGTSANIVKSMVSCLNAKSISLNSIKAIGCDGTNVNTGWKGGVIRLMEKQIGKPVQWLICLLHANELPLRHILQALDGKTTGPNSLSGPIGSLLATCESRPIENFIAIEADLPKMNEEDLSTDQKYLYQICCAIKTGTCCDTLSKKNPGKLGHARWLTTANRILRLYVSTSEPSETLIILSKYIMKVYAPMWFHIKTKPLCQYGAQHLWKSIILSREFPENIKKIIDNVIRTNAYFAHPENILLGMITDSRSNIRELGLRRVLKSRNTEVQGNLRVFKIPKINWDAKDYIDLIDWSTCVVTEPPLLRDISNEDLTTFIKEKVAIKLNKFPCHTQAVERCVKIITEASGKVCGHESRDGYIKVKFESRSELPSYENKEEYYKSKKIKLTTDI